MKIISRFLCTSILPLVLLAQSFAAQPGGHLNITQVLVDDPDNPTSLMIIGEQFDFGPGPLVVTLGEFGPLTIIGTPTDTLIEASLPAPISDGDFLLTVSNGGGQSEDDEYDLTIGAIGPEGPQGPQGEQGVPGNLALAGMSCPIGEFMRGFDVAGDILCGLPDGSNENPFPNCGNGVLDPDEVCDGAAGLQTCSELHGPGDWTGSIICEPGCQDFSDTCALAP